MINTKQTLYANELATGKTFFVRAYGNAAEAEKVAKDLELKHIGYHFYYVDKPVNMPHCGSFFNHVATKQ
jgi:hypothetical protein